jgi:cytochrome c peroxidase
MSGKRWTLWASGFLLLWGCSAEFSAQEMEALRRFELGEQPPSPTNQYADDARAAALGQKFFFDPRFSGPLQVASDLGPVGASGKVSCASCHDPARGGADHRSRPGNTSLAAGFTGRNSPTVYNTGWSRWMFWDGRKDSVWSQALGPIESPVEHNFTRLEVAHIIYGVPGYRSDYEAIFGTIPAELSNTSRFPARGMPGDGAFDGMASGDKELVNRIFANFGKAIEAYERRLVDRDSAFDKWLAGDEESLSMAAKRGAKLFVGKAACNECHANAVFADDKFHNTGVAQVGPNIPSSDRGRAVGIADVKGDEFNQAGIFSDSRQGAHLETLAARAADEGAFKTPSLRSISKSAPYMHTGSLRTLRDVVVFYRNGGEPSGFDGTKDPAMRPLNLNEQEIDDLVEFLESLDGAPLPQELVVSPLLP